MSMYLLARVRRTVRRCVPSFCACGGLVGAALLVTPGTGAAQTHGRVSSALALVEAPAAPAHPRAAASSGRVRVMSPQDRRLLPLAQGLVPLANAIDASMALNSLLTFQVMDCDGRSPYYHPRSQTIVVCADFLQSVNALFQSYRNGDQLASSAIGFTVLHELGHAIVHIQGLPIAGREEDAADQFAAYFALMVGEPDYVQPLAAAAMFDELSRSSRSVSDALQAGDHGLPRQRMYNLRCWAYGANPARLAAIVTEGLLPVDRAERCMAEAARLERSWSALLEGTIK
ncbi:MAG: hypothetical protein IPK85_05255 [Gemmatimonadetes bacterium]|nr:hypothetical protein [Gemmatimonadota bacterium]